MLDCTVAILHCVAQCSKKTYVQKVEGKDHEGGDLDP